MYDVVILLLLHINTIITVPLEYRHQKIGLWCHHRDREGERRGIQRERERRGEGGRGIVGERKR